MALKRFRSPTLTNAQAAWYVMLVILALPTAVVVDYVTGPPHSPTETVRRYLEAVREGDVDAALEYLQVTVVPDPPADDLQAQLSLFGAQSMDSAVITESGAWFLHSDAVGTDWEVLDIREAGDESGFTGGGYADTTLVDVVIGNGSGTSSGTFAVSAEEPDRILDGFVAVTFGPGADTFIRANQRVLDIDVGHAVCCGLDSIFPTTYAMFPGIYDFRGTAQESEQVALLPGNEPAHIPAAVPAIDDTAIAAVESALVDYIDACAEATIREMQYCPFASDGKVDSEQAGRVHVEDEARVLWEPVEYPTVTLEVVQDRSYGLRIRIRVEDLGLLRLSGTGEDLDKQPIDFTALCHFDTAHLIAYFNHDGSAEIRWDEVGEDLYSSDVSADSCRGTTA